MTTPQYVPPGAMARDIWKYEPWARKEARRHLWVQVVWIIPMAVLAVLVVPIAFTPLDRAHLAFGVLLGVVFGTAGTMLVSVVGVQVREYNQKAFIANQLAGGVDPRQVRGIPDVPGRMTFPARLFLANTIAFALVGGIAFLAAWAVIGY